MRRLGSMLGVFAVIATWGCGGSSTDPKNDKPTVPDSAFVAAITGSITDSLTGPALYQELLNNVGNDSAFALSFGIGTQTGAFIFLRLTPGVPALGSYSLYPDTAQAVPDPSQFFAVGALGPTGCGASCSITDLLLETSGTLTITNVTATRVSGTFTFDGFDVPASNTSERNPISATGAFNAALGPAVGGGGSGCGVTVKCERVRWRALAKSPR